MREIYALGVLVEARLRELAPKVLFFRSQADDTSRGTGYVILDLDAGDLAYRRAAGRPEHDLRFMLRVCGASPGIAANTLDMVRAHLSGWHPFPADLALGELREVSAGPELLDDTVVDDPRWSYTLTYEMDDGDDYAY